MLLADLPPDIDARIIGLRAPEGPRRKGRGRRRGRRRGRWARVPGGRRHLGGRGRRRRRGRGLRVPGDLWLKEIGLRPGERIRVVQKAGLGGRLVGLGCARIAIDLGTARCIEVEVLE